MDAPTLDPRCWPLQVRCLLCVLRMPFFPFINMCGVSSASASAPTTSWVIQVSPPTPFLLPTCRTLFCFYLRALLLTATTTFFPAVRRVLVQTFDDCVRNGPRPPTDGRRRPLGSTPAAGGGDA